MKKIVLVVIAFSVILGLSSHSFADWRRYVWTYEYMTMPKGMFEVEYYLTEEQENIDHSKPNIWKHWVELEYGITDHLDIAMYQQFRQANKASSSTFEYDGFKIRTRYRIAEKNEFPLDTLLYLEYKRDDDFDKPNALEAKIVIAKDIGAFNIAYNQILEQELESNGETEHEYAAGISYGISPHFRVGMETKGNYTESKYYVGPTLSWATNKFWTALGIAAGLNKRSDDLQARLIVGVPF